MTSGVSHDDSCMVSCASYKVSLCLVSNGISQWHMVYCDVCAMSLKFYRFP